MAPLSSSITWSTLRDLAAFRSANGCAVSVYVDLDPSASPTAADLETRFNSLLARGEKLAESYSGDHDCRRALRDDLARLRRWWDGEFERDGVRGLAVFASSLDGLFRTLPLREHVSDGIHLGRDLRLSPLAGAVGRSDGALVAVVSREQGRVFALVEGRLEEEVDETEETLGQHDQGGWSQARYQRHIDKLVHDHLKNVGDQLDRRARRTTDLQLVVVAPEEMRGDIEGLLSAEAREALVGWTSAESHVTPAELLEVVRPLIEEGRARREHEILERWREERGRGQRAAAGWEETLAAAADARVDVLLLEENATREAWQCPVCGRGSASGGNCPLDGATLEQCEDGADVAVHGVLGHGGTVLALGSGALADAAGVGALLRF
ncbi:MAG TPA: Vms1/Ankzf1 family peptidyl-tRNA hydrolase [Gaiellaceae bacterium]